MFDLPKSCVVNKFIPKNIFYKKVTMATSVKKEFINLIEKITWLYKIAPDTLGVNKTDNIEELEILEIQLKQKQLPKNVIKVITKSISYPILFVIKYNNDFCYSTKVEKDYYSDWNENITFDFNYNNLNSIYESIVKKIIKEETNTKSFNEIISINAKKRELEKQIAQLKSKISQEKQFNRKVELNQELRKLEQEMEELISE